MDNYTLRTLSRRYAAGDIDRNAYRVQRRALIEAIVNGTAELITYRAPEPDAPTVFPYDEDDGDTTQEIMGPITVPASVTPTRRVGVYVILAAILGLTAAIAWWLTRPATQERSEPRPPIAERPAADAALLESFLSANAWSPENLLEFERAWAALSADDRAALLDEDARRRLGEGVLEQIATENALIELGDVATALDSQRALLDFADHLGIDDPRLTRAEQAWNDAQRSFLSDSTPDHNATGVDQPDASTRR